MSRPTTKSHHRTKAEDIEYQRTFRCSVPDLEKLLEEPEEQERQGLLMRISQGKLQRLDS